MPGGAVGAASRCPRCPEGSAQVLGAGNGASTWFFSITAPAGPAALPGRPPGGICSAKQIERDGVVLGLLAARMGSHCPRGCKPEPRPSAVLRKNTDRVPSPRHAGFRLGGLGAQGHPPALCMGTPELSSALTKATQPVQESRACTPGPWPRPAQASRWFVCVCVGGVDRRHWMCAKACSLVS